MSTRLSDLPMETLQAMLRDTEQAVGPDAVSVRILRRAVAAKEVASGLLDDPLVLSQRGRQPPKRREGRP